MPGTIQVTVLEFKGASSSSQPSAKSLKVSMGKRYHQSWDKADFSFPVIKLKENLVVTLLDAGENEIAHADIRTIHIIEKGCWDEVFSLEGEGGGGHVHMKLQFILNEEERNRIRVMRDSAVKKKHETSPITDPIISARNSSTCDSVQLSTQSELKISGERVTRTIAHQCLEAKPDEEKEISEQETSEKHNVLHGTIAKIWNRFSSRKETGSHSSPDVSPNGLVGQVIKVVAILGFGVLVFLTRQKEQRKKNREDKDSLFTVPDYIDRMPFTES